MLRAEIIRIGRPPLRRVNAIYSNRFQWLSYLIRLHLAYRSQIIPRLITGNTRLPITRLSSVPIGEARVLNRPQRLGGIPCIRPLPECLLAPMKRQGFNLEDAHITDPDRVTRLIGVMALALRGCYKAGLWLDQQQPIIIKKHQRRAYSVIRLGLDTLRRALLNYASQTCQIRYLDSLPFL